MAYLQPSFLVTNYPNATWKVLQVNKMYVIVSVGLDLWAETPSVLPKEFLENSESCNPKNCTSIVLALNQFII